MAIWNLNNSKLWVYQRVTITPVSCVFFCGSSQSAKIFIVSPPHRRRRWCHPSFPRGSWESAGGEFSGGPWGWWSPKLELMTSEQQTLRPKWLKASTTKDLLKSSVGWFKIHTTQIGRSKVWNVDPHPISISWRRTLAWFLFTSGLKANSLSDSWIARIAAIWEWPTPSYNGWVKLRR